MLPLHCLTNKTMNTAAGSSRSDPPAAGMDAYILWGPSLLFSKKCATLSKNKIIKNKNLRYCSPRNECSWCYFK